MNRRTVVWLVASLAIIFGSAIGLASLKTADKESIRRLEGQQKRILQILETRERYASRAPVFMNRTLDRTAPSPRIEPATISTGPSRAALNGDGPPTPPQPVQLSQRARDLIDRAVAAGGNWEDQHRRELRSLLRDTTPGEHNAIILRLMRLINEGAIRTNGPKPLFELRGD
jgi:hypothetical protein